MAPYTILKQSNYHKQIKIVLLNSKTGCVYVCVYVYVYTYIYVYVYVYGRMHILMYVCMHVRSER